MQKKSEHSVGRGEFVQLKNQKEANELRAKLVEEQGWVCPISGWKITVSTSHLDHDHQTGLCRAALHPAVNRSLSQDSIRRFGVPYKDQPRILRGMADYIERNIPTDYLHHSVKPKDLIIKQSNYEALGYLIVNSGTALPSWWGYVWRKPGKRRKNRIRGQKLTKRLDALYKKYNFEPAFYSVAPTRKKMNMEDK